MYEVAFGFLNARNLFCGHVTSRGVYRMNRLHSQKWSQIVRVLFNDKYLLYTNLAISVASSSTGDAIQQHYEILKSSKTDQNGQSFQVHRSIHMGFSGLSVGLVCHYWYQFLDRRLIGTSVKTVLKKVIVDQLVCSPACILAFFLTTSFLEKMTFDEFFEEFQEKSMQLYVAEWIIWPPAQVINFYYLPTRFRVLYDSVISLGYDVYTSRVKHKKSLRSDS